MRHTMFHLGYATKFGPPAWQSATDRTHGRDWPSGRYFGDLARELERACFDVLFFPDTLCVNSKGRDGIAGDLRNALNTPQHESLALLANLAARTERIGLVATASTTFYPPYLLARLLSTIDSLSEGRVGWNIVTSTLEDEARNFGMTLPPSELRYDMADEFLEIAMRLWRSWEPDALVADPAQGVYVDPTKVHPVEYVGEHHRVHGLLNTLPSPQHTPVLFQAGASDRGRDFAAKHAEVVFYAASDGAAGMRAFREDIHRRMAAFGRKPEEVRFMWATRLAITHPDDPDPGDWDTTRFELLVDLWSKTFDTDLSAFDLDKPLPVDVESRGTKSLMDRLKADGTRGKTLRQGLIELHHGVEGFTASADSVAHTLATLMDDVGGEGDGIMFIGADVGDGEYVRRITQELVPRLQEMGCVPTAYRGTTLRENLFTL